MVREVVMTSGTAKSVDLVDVLGAEFGVGDAESGFGGEGEDGDLALVEVAVDLVGGLAGVIEGEGLGDGGVDHALGDQAVGLVCLAVVGEVGADDALEGHPTGSGCRTRACVRWWMRR